MNNCLVMINLEEAKKSDRTKIVGTAGILVAHYLLKQCHAKNHVDQNKWMNEINNFETELGKILKRLSTKKNLKIDIDNTLYKKIVTRVKRKIKKYNKCDNITDTEIDIVINLGKFLIGDTKAAHKEICKLKESAGNAKLKVILETGLLPDYNAVWQASLLAMDAGADFIKTSTGKFQPAATPDKFYVMAMAIKEFYDKTGHKVGIKPAGGISTIEDALIYFYIVKSVIGNEWLNKSLFRIGASRLAENIFNEL